PTHTSSLLIFLSTDTATPDLSTLSLHDALPISSPNGFRAYEAFRRFRQSVRLSGRQSASTRMSCATLPGSHPWRHGITEPTGRQDRKSTRLNSSHLVISYAVFCLKKKKKNQHSS